MGLLENPQKPEITLNEPKLVAGKKQGRKIEGDEPLDQKVTLNLSKSEKAQIEAKCKALGGLPVTKLIRAALIQAGLL